MKILEEAWEDRTCVKAIDADGETISMGVHYTRERTARVWTALELARERGGHDARSIVLYECDLSSLRARVSQEASGSVITKTRIRG